MKHVKTRGRRRSPRHFRMPGGVKVDTKHETDARLLIDRWRGDATTEMPDIPSMGVAVHTIGESEEQVHFYALPHDAGGVLLGAGSSDEPELGLFYIQSGTVKCFGSAVRTARIYRSTTTAVETVLLPDLTDGREAVAQATIKLWPGDTVLLIGDEFENLVSPEGRPIGPHRAAEELAAVGALSASEIRDHLELICRAWTASKEHECVRMLVIKREPVS